MTKKDGDKLRKMKTDLYDMADQYERGSLTQSDMRKIAAAIDAALRGRKFSVTGTNISEAHRKERDATRNSSPA